jgi:hypothetical protein
MGCRKMKEDFAKDWSGGRLRTKYKVQVEDRMVYLVPESAEEFERRARSYTPSDVARQYFGSAGGRTAELADLRNVDLFEWIARTIRGKDDEALKAGEFTKVLLTGGSCGWPFMKPLVAKTLGISEGRIKVSANPLITVGLGLTLYPILREHYRVKSKAIEEARPKKTIDFKERIHKSVIAFSERVAKKCVAEVMPSVRDRFHQWYDNGGVLNDVASFIDQDIETKKPLIETIIRKEYDTLTTDLDRIRIDFIKDWLKEHGVARSPQELGLCYGDIAAPREMEFDGSVGKISDDMAAVTTTVTGLVAGIAVIVVTMIKGKVIVAMFLANPILGVIAVFVVIAGGGALNEWLKEKVAEHNWQGMRFSAMKLAVSKEKIDDALDKTAADLRVKLQGEIEAMLSKLEAVLSQQFDSVTDRVLEDFTVLEDFREREQ